MPEKVIYLFYRSILALAAPVVLFYALVRIAKNRAYAGTLRERLGFLPASFRPGGSGAIWIHAVSVGETIAAETLIQTLHQPLPVPVFVSTSTLAGYETAKKRLGGITSGVFYAPLDYALIIRRVLRRLEPSVVVVLETEIWPNLFRETKRAGCGLLIANARISDRAFPKYRRWSWLFRSVLRWPDAILAQSEEMRQRFIRSGAPQGRVSVSGNLKYDCVPRAPEPDSPAVQWAAAHDGPVLIAASTTADAQVDEDQIVIDALAALPGWRLILAPRKPERFDAAAKRLQGTTFWRRSSSAFRNEDRVLLLDTVGELASLFPLSSAVFMGGTLTETGGHNFLEPAMAGKPVIVGPRLENFREIAEDFRAHRALIEIENGGDLAGAVLRASGDQRLGERARERAEALRGAAETTVEAIRALHGAALFACPVSWMRRLLFSPLAELWEWGARGRLRRELMRQEKLSTPVISVGNITVGGTGKTPFVLYLAHRFRERGFEPVVLSRGYGRISHRERLILPRQSQAAVWHTGDEPQILLRSGACGLGIGSDRCVTGKEAEATLHPHVFLLDDGFSHLRLARDLDIVLIDALDPFGGGEIVPLGRLREPIEGLARADIFVITRCETFRPMPAIEHKLRTWNGRAPIFKSKIVAQKWISLQSGEVEAIPERVVAFCGLGNPKSFWNTLESLGVHPLDRVSYGDHHAYNPREIQALLGHARNAGAQALVCTEKDVVNLPDGSLALFGDLPVLWLRVEVDVDDEAGLFREIAARTHLPVQGETVSSGADDLRGTNVKK